MRAARWILSTGIASFRTMPPDTEKRVTGVVCWKIVALLSGAIRTEETFVPTKRFVGTKTYSVGLMRTGRPEYPEMPNARVGGRGAQPT